jgi:hypothetical protein
MIFKIQINIYLSITNEILKLNLIKQFSYQSKSHYFSKAICIIPMVTRILINKIEEQIMI